MAKKNSNSLMVLRVTMENDIWAFNDPEKGLHREPFVAGADALCEALAKSVGSKSAVTIIFSENQFPTAVMRLNWVKFEMGGNVYELAGSDHKAWLCPALLKYFDKAPKTIYVEAKK